MKEKIKQLPFVGKTLIIIKSYIDCLEFNRDKHFFKKNYMIKEDSVNKISYSLLLEIHKLEKGMLSNNLRPFGLEKVKKILSLLEKNKISNNSFAYNLAISCLHEYKNIYENNKWTEKLEYKIVNNFLKINNKFQLLNVGTYEISSNEIMKNANIDYMKFLKSRHSIRNFSAKKLEDIDIKKAVEMAIMSPSACNRQMIKCYYAYSEDSKKIITKYAQGLSLFNLENINYFLITFDVSANYFIGERNQGWLNSGLFTMNFINALHSLGIGSCCIQFGNKFKQENIIKKSLNIPKSERIAVILAAGYYDNLSKVTYSSRKSLEDIYYVR